MMRFEMVKQPKTSQVSPLAFEKTFTEMAQNNEQGIYIAFSSQLSGTYQTAVMILDQVKETYPNFQNAPLSIRNVPRLGDWCHGSSPFSKCKYFL